MNTLSAEVVKVMEKWLADGRPIKALARRYNISLSLLYNVRNGYDIPKIETRKRILNMIEVELRPEK